MKKSTRVLKEVDPNLNVISGRRRRKAPQMTPKDWEKLDGDKCPTCQRDILKRYGPHGQCKTCFGREKGIYLNERECPKCGARAAEVTTLAQGLQTVKIICASCGTYQA